MGKQISYFNVYHKNENAVTNYCGLMLKLLYQSSPTDFQECINTLCQNAEITVGPTFEQQVSKKNSVPDLEIKQESFIVDVETKTSDWFHEDQLSNHIIGMKQNYDQKYLILLCNFEVQKVKANIIDAEILAKKKNVKIVLVPFELLAETLESACKSPSLKTIFDEFYQYLDINKLLPKWKYILDVVNCAGTQDEIIDNNVYICPDLGGQYNHKRAQYFGLYKNKMVSRIYNIDAVVIVEQNSEKTNIQWKREDVLDKTKLENIAKNKIDLLRREEIKTRNLKVFILSDGRDVSFEKDSSGGLYGSKIYFEFPNCQCINDVENEIKIKKVWSAVR